MDYVKSFDDNLDKVLNQFVKKPTLIRGVVHLLLILYAARLAPMLPKVVLNLFENSYFKLFIFSLILWTSQFSPSTALLIAVGFMVTMNYINKKPLWEFLENTDTSAPTAPTKNVAVESAVAIVEQQTQKTPVVQAVAQQENTIVIQPTIIDTPQGKTVVNPTIVVAPAVVETESGEKVLVKPDVTVVEPPTKAADAIPAPVQAVKVLADAAASPSAAPAKEIAKIAEVAIAATKTEAGVAAVKELVDQAVRPEAGDAGKVADAAQTAVADMKQGGSCFPLRSYNIEKVMAFSATEYSDFKA